MNETTKKWTSTAGPIQTKKVNKAIQDISWEGRTYSEKTGVIGGEEHETSFTQIFGGQREDASKALIALGAKFNWTVTRENYQSIIEAVALACAELRKTRPVKDSRRTLEQVSTDEAERKARDEKRAAADIEKNAKRNALIPEFKHKYPWAILAQPGLSEHARCAQNIRTDLATTFRGITFRVKSEPSRISIHWDLGPTEKEVQSLIGKYKDRAWVNDGGDGYYNYDNSPEGEAITVILGRIDYISTSRSIPEGVYDQVGRLLCELKRQPFDLREVLLGDDNVQVADHVHRLTYGTSFPAGATVKAVQDPQAERAAWNDEMLVKYNTGWAMQARRAELSPEDREKIEAFEAQDSVGDIHDSPFKLVLEVNATPAVAPVTGTSGIRVARSAEHNGVELYFPSKPDAHTLARLKGSGWRWSVRNKCWYKKYSEAAFAEANQIAGVATTAPSSDPAGSYAEAQEAAYQDNLARSIGA